MLLLVAVLLAQADPLDMPGAIVRDPMRKEAPCALQLSLVQRRTATELELDGVLVNVSKVPQTFRLENRCPFPSLVLSGLPETIDPFKSCMKGMCIIRDAVERTLGPGERLVVATATLGRNDSQCGGPLRGGPYSVSASVPFAGPAPIVCPGKPVTVEGWPPPSKDEPPTPPVKPRCPPIACKIPQCPPGQLAVDDKGCVSCSCR